MPFLWLHKPIKALVNRIKQLLSEERFTCEMEVDSKLAFLYILLHRDGHDIIETVYRKATNNDVYGNKI